MASSTKHIDQIYANAVAYAKDRAGGERAFWIVGSTFRKGLVAQALLQSLFAQDDQVSAESVRSLLDELYTRLTDDQSLEA